MFSGDDFKYLVSLQVLQLGIQREKQASHQHCSNYKGNQILKMISTELSEIRYKTKKHILLS